MSIFNVPPQNKPQKISKFLLGKLPQFSKLQIFGLLRKHRIRINGKIANRHHSIKAGDTIRVFDEVNNNIDQMVKIRHSNLYKKLLLNRIIAEDDAILILNKDHHLCVQTDENTPFEKTLLGLATAYTAEKNQKIWLVHRLDRNTSGLIILAKNKKAVQNLAQQFREHTIIKKYLALIKGKMKQNHGKITTKLLKTKQGTTKTDNNGSPTLTLWEKIVNFSNAALLDLQIKTGKMHQIRVHLASIGHPIIGDTQYGDPKFNKIARELGVKRQFLHAYHLEFTHPETNQLTTYETELPKDLAKIIKIWPLH